MAWSSTLERVFLAVRSTGERLPVLFPPTDMAREEGSLLSKLEGVEWKASVANGNLTLMGRGKHFVLQRGSVPLFRGMYGTKHEPLLSCCDVPSWSDTPRRVPLSVTVPEYIYVRDVFSQRG
jgi:hypothetical protein